MGGGDAQGVVREVARPLVDSRYRDSLRAVEYTARVMRVCDAVGVWDRPGMARAGTSGRTLVSQTRPIGPRVDRGRLTADDDLVSTPNDPLVSTPSLAGERPRRVPWRVID